MSTPASRSGPVLEIDHLVTTFFTEKGEVRAVNDVSLALGRGEVLGLVGESGSGKSMLGFSIMGLLDAPGRITGGSIRFGGRDLVPLRAEDKRRLRGNRIAMIFQDPMMTLNPVLRVDTQMIEAIQAHERVSRAAARERAGDALALVGIPDPRERLRAYPHQFSGGMRQRVAIAIAMLHQPDLIIADEPTTALDVTIQAQILARLSELVRSRGLSMIWISHDLSVVSRLADNIAVMYAGRIVEYGQARAVIEAPRHPYTVGLIGSVPSRNEPGRRLRQIPGMPPDLTRLPPGCAFRGRCFHAADVCAEEPPVDAIAGRRLRCFRPVTQTELAS